jgi:hypothetical protein
MAFLHGARAIGGIGEELLLAAVIAGDGILTAIRGRAKLEPNLLRMAQFELGGNLDGVAGGPSDRLLLARAQLDIAKLRPCSPQCLQLRQRLDSQRVVGTQR